MKLLRKNLLLVVFCSLAACGGIQATDIYTPRGIEISQKNVDMKDIEKAIVNAGVKRGWVMKKVGEGKMKGTLFVRRHVVEVFVTYNKENFNIEYADSKNMYYNPTEKTIHKNYNSWVKNLENDIQIALGGASSLKN